MHAQRTLQHALKGCAHVALGSWNLLHAWQLHAHPRADAPRDGQLPVHAFALAICCCCDEHCWAASAGAAWGARALDPACGLMQLTPGQRTLGAPCNPLRVLASRHSPGIPTPRGNMAFVPWWRMRHLHGRCHWPTLPLTHIAACDPHATNFMAAAHGTGHHRMGRARALELSAHRRLPLLSASI